jgi:hydrogenase expression/formation protein HypE
VTTDSYVVSPLFFPGGDIGELAVGGAEPLCVTAGFILEEGLPVAMLRRVVESMAAAAAAGVRLLAGDTKVVPRGKADLLFVNTTGIGLVAEPARLGVGRVREGDAVLVSGTIGDHGTAIMLARGDLDLESDLESDTAALHTLCRAALAAGDVHLMRDATRGGIATVLNELAQEAGLAVAIREDAIPVRDEVRGASEILGIDPCTWPTRASWWRWSPARTQAGCWQRCGPIPWAGTRPSPARSSPSRPGWSSCTRRSAAREWWTC